MEFSICPEDTVTNSVTPVCWSKSGGAIFDPTGFYRYTLWRCWEPDGPKVLFIMLNPSTADGTRDDPTIRRCRRFAQTWGYGGVEIVNLFALRATHPRDLRRSDQPIGSANDGYVRAAVSEVARVVAAWGNHGGWMGRDRTVLRQLVSTPLFCLGRTRSGQPYHPLYRRQDTPLQPFE